MPLLPDKGTLLPLVRKKAKRHKSLAPISQARFHLFDEILAPSIHWVILQLSASCVMQSSSQMSQHLFGFSSSPSSSSSPVSSHPISSSPPSSCPALSSSPSSPPSYFFPDVRPQLLRIPIFRISEANVCWQTQTSPTTPELISPRGIL